jgi:hypothetical protein
MQIEYTQVEDNIIQYKCTDDDDRVYGVGDTIVRGKIVDTIVIDMETYDEIEDSELFKRIVTARSVYAYDNYIVEEALRSIS